MSNRIRELRHRANQTQVEAAKKAGLPQSQWSDVERREKLDGTSLRVLRRIAIALGVAVTELY